MSMRQDTAIATAADYADALMSARRAKNVLAIVLLLLIIAQLVLFFLVRYDVLVLNPPPEAATQPAGGIDWRLALHYAVGLTTFGGVTLSIVLSLVLLLIVNIMLVGRLIGVGRLTSAYIWALVLVVLLFPWQSFLNNVNLTPDRATFKIPGVLYTFQELADPQVGAKFPNEPLLVAFLKWTRFVAAPLVALIILLVIQVKSNRGIRQSLGEDEPPATGESTESAIS
ncbi:hypothetical protein [Fontivita pretiosa]|uniref:hypothetical protein n=1 Tax=Fontivita pretiosa TaxID=2989684 RepID=UPI003D166FB9